MNAGVMSMVAKAASTLQRNGEKGEVRNADAEAIPFLAMEEILERLKILNYEREMPGSFKPLTHTYFAIASGNPTEQFHYFMAGVRVADAAAAHPVARAVADGGPELGDEL